MHLVDNILECSQESNCKRFIRSLNQNQLKELRGEIFSRVFWHRKKATFSQVTKAQVALLLKLNRFLDKCLKRSNCPIEVNTNGCRIDRDFTLMDCHSYSAKLLRDANWSVLYVDNHCHQYFINENTLEIISFCEGDLVTRTANSLHMLMKEMHAIFRWFANENS